MNCVFMNGVSTIIFSRISFSYIIILFIGYTLRVTSVLTIVNIFFSRKNKWAPGLKVGSSTKIFSYKNAFLFFFECNNSWATYFISNFFFKHQLPFIKFLWTLLVIVQLKKWCKLLDIPVHVFILTAIHMRYTQKTWFECLMYLYSKDKIA